MSFHSVDVPDHTRAGGSAVHRRAGDGLAEPSGPPLPERVRRAVHETGRAFDA